MYFRVKAVPHFQLTKSKIIYRKQNRILLEGDNLMKLDSISGHLGVFPCKYLKLDLKRIGRKEAGQHKKKCNVIQEGLLWGILCDTKVNMDYG